MATIWVAFMQEFPWVCKLPLCDCLEMFYYYLELDTKRPQTYVDWVNKKFVAFEQSVKDKEDIFETKID